MNKDIASNESIELKQEDFTCTTRYKQKAKLSRYQTTNLLKTWFLFMVSMKGLKRDKSEFSTKFVKVIVAIIFI